MTAHMTINSDIGILILYTNSLIKVNDALSQPVSTVVNNMTINVVNKARKCDYQGSYRKWHNES